MTVDEAEAELTRLVAGYASGDCANCVDVLVLFDGLNLDEAIRYAALSTYGRPPRRYSHQRRLPRHVLAEAAVALAAQQAAFAACCDFDAVYAIVADAFERIPGAGKLYAYDVAQRIGRALGLQPKSVYLHSGAETGARYLGVRGRPRRPGHRIDGRVAGTDRFPSPMRDGLKVFEIEDFLCIYKNQLRRIGPALRRHS